MASAGALALAGGALGAAGAGVSAVAQKQQADFRADLAERNARQARLDAQARAERQERANRRRLGAARAVQGVSGAQVGSGSPLEFLSDQAAEAQEQVALIEQQGRIQATEQRARAQAFEQRSQAALIGGATKAAGSLISGGTKSLSRKGGLSSGPS